MSTDRLTCIAGRARSLALRGRYADAAALRQPLLRSVMIARVARPLPHSPAESQILTPPSPLSPGTGAGLLREQDATDGTRDRNTTKSVPSADSRAAAEEPAGARGCV